MTESIERRIDRKISAHGRGWVFSWLDFANVGSREAVEVSLHRLVKKQKIRRIACGIYDFPKVGTIIEGLLSPDLDSVAFAIARKYGWDIRPTEVGMLNLLGISEQVPGRIVYNSNGPSRVFKVGLNTIEFLPRRLTHHKKPPANRDLYFRRVYGITLDEYEAMLMKQDGRCAICRIHHSTEGRHLAVDHDHATGKVRGLLCSKCNTGLGYFGDSITKMLDAIRYISDSKEPS